MKMSSSHSINCKGKLLSFSRPLVMGILNITPNSFFDGGKHNSVKQAVFQTEKMLNEGADIIDIGAYSSQPNAEFVSEEMETERLLPVIKTLLKEFPDILISVDTFRANVADKAIDEGATIINDISGGDLDKNMLHVAAQQRVPYIMMHMRGTPQNMQQFTDYEDVTKEIIHYFSERLAQAYEAGIKDVIIDPGFGFSKTLDQNYELLSKLNLFQHLDVPILAGISRKSMIYKFLETTPQEALNGTTVLNTLALMSGANILRVHDVKEATECVKLYIKTYEK